MLILMRRIQEKIIIGNDDIRVIILDIKGNQVKLGIQAPEDITVHREEIYQRIQDERGFEDESDQETGD